MIHSGCSKHNFRAVTFSVTLLYHWYQTIARMQACCTTEDGTGRKGCTDSWQQPPVSLALWVPHVPRCISSQGKVWDDRGAYG